MLSPKPFTLSSDADSPDTDGLFLLNWTISVGADNYSIYMHTGPITEINGSVSNITSGLTDLNYSMSLGSGTYYFLVQSYNETGFTDSNQIMVIVDIQLGPKDFILSSDADSPDTDGQFVLNWTIAIGADNYTIYRYSSAITEINGSVVEVVSGLTDLNYSMSLANGTYYFLVRSYNETGFTDSNQIMVTVEITPGAPEGVFDLMSFLTNPLTIVNFGIMIGVLAGIIIKFRKKYYKSGDKEIKRIEEIRHKKE
jgi:hypothetical protein